MPIHVVCFEGARLYLASSRSPCEIHALAASLTCVSPKMGYLEGEVTNGVQDGVKASVAWYQADALSGSVQAGFASLAYPFLASSKTGDNGTSGSVEGGNNMSDMVYGPSWGRNMTRTSQVFGNLSGTGGIDTWMARECVRVEEAEEAEMRARCLWTPRGGKAGVEEEVRGLDGVKFSSDEGDVDEMQLCLRDLTVVSAVNRKYGDASCNGTANCSVSRVVNRTFAPASATRLSLRDSYGLVATWNEAGAIGSGAYVVTRDAVSQLMLLQGWECEGAEGSTTYMNVTVNSSAAKVDVKNVTLLRNVTRLVSLKNATGNATILVNATSLENVTSLANVSTNVSSSTIERRVIVQEASARCRMRQYALLVKPADCEGLARRACALSLDWLGVRQRKKMGAAYTGEASTSPVCSFARGASVAAWVCWSRRLVGHVFPSSMVGLFSFACAA